MLRAQKVNYVIHIFMDILGIGLIIVIFIMHITLILQGLMKENSVLVILD